MGGARARAGRAGRRREGRPPKGRGGGRGGGTGGKGREGGGAAPAPYLFPPGGASGAVAIRHLATQDLDAVISMVETTFAELFAHDMYAAIQQAWPAGQLVAMDAGRITGLLLAIMRTEFSARILVMAVAAPARGRGLGSELLRAFLRQCMMEGITEVVLEVRASNLRAQAFYGRHGFHRRSVLPRYYRDGEDGYVMVRGVA